VKELAVYNVAFQFGSGNWLSGINGLWKNHSSFDRAEIADILKTAWDYSKLKTLEIDESNISPIKNDSIDLKTNFTLGYMLGRTVREGAYDLTEGMHPELKEYIENTLGDHGSQIQLYLPTPIYDKAIRLGTFFNGDEFRHDSRNNFSSRLIMNIAYAESLQAKPIIKENFLYRGKVDKNGWNVGNSSIVSLDGSSFFSLDTDIEHFSTKIFEANKIFQYLKREGYLAPVSLEMDSKILR
jgi:hypothetical protein